MYEKNEKDFLISKSENFEKYGLNVSIGTFSNDYLSIIGLLSYLKINNNNNNKLYKSFMNELKQQNKEKKIFNNKNKQNHINYIKKYGLNYYSLFNFDKLKIFISELDDLNDNEYLDLKKIKSYIDSNINRNKCIGIIKKSKDIEHLYKLVIEFKDKLEKYIYNDYFNFIVK